METQAQEPRARPRPTADETFAAAVELATRGSGRFKRFARRFSLCTADAEDAYQRSLEILLNKAPTADLDELGAWLHTVIKHEALALRRQRERALSGGGNDDPQPRAETAPALDEQASERERVRQTAEALAHLKPGEIQCLLLKALGYSYDEIAARTGFSWTKVNRSLTEGRRRFLARFGELGAGERCGEFQALLSVACDGEASEHEQRTLRAHLDRCGSCRAALRSYRAAPGRLAELLPPGIVLGLTQQQAWWSKLAEWLPAGAGDRAAAVAWKVQQGAEAISAQKAAAVIASTAAVAGGAAVHEGTSNQRAQGNGAPHVKRGPKAQAAAAAPVPAPAPVPAAPERAAPEPREQPSAPAAPAEEFAPSPASAAPPVADVEPAASASEFAGPSATGGRGAGGGEFGP